MRRPLAALAALLAVTAAAAAAAPAALAGPSSREPAADASEPAVEPTTAEDWLRLGLTRYDSGDFTGAVAAFRAGHAIEPRAAFLFAIAQAERRRGDCAAAIRYYEQFLVTSPAPEQEQAAIEQRDRCRQALAATIEPEPEPEPEPPPAPEPEPEPASTRAAVSSPASAGPRWWRDPLSLGLGGGAAVATILGVGLLLSADSAASGAAIATDYDQYAALRDRAESRSLTGTVALSAGLALAGATVFRILQVGRRDRRDRRDRRAEPGRELAIGAGPGLGLGVAGTF